MVRRLVFPLCKQHWLMNLGKLLFEVVSGESSVQGETLAELSDVLDVQPLGILLQMVFPVVDTELGTLIGPVVAVNTAHGVSAGHLNACDFSVYIFETLKKGGVIDLALRHVI